MDIENHRFTSFLTRGLQNLLIVARTKTWMMALLTGLGWFGIVIGVVATVLLVVQDDSWWPLIVGFWFVAIGGLWLSMCNQLWRRSGDGLGLGEDGIHWWRICLSPSKRHIVIPWADICNVRAIRFEIEGGSEHGLLVGLRESAKNPTDRLRTRIALKQQNDPPPWSNVLLIHDSHWSWDAREVERQIMERLPASRR